jgi:AcrR family transcriptional regulator
MHTAVRTARLAGEDLVEQRHICALVDGPDDADELLIPFVVDGFEQGDRAFHVVDPKGRDEHLERLSASGVDVPAATASRQLEVQTWNESYLRGGRFNGSAQLSFLRQVLAEGHALGFPLTRLIGSMQWTLQGGIPGDLFSYEARINELIRRLPDIVVCVYDLRQHTARTTADILGVHPVALVGGVLRSSQGPTRPSARDRLLAAASQLFHENGVQATGVDLIVGEAGVAKATFYRHFPSKDDLIVAWLRDPRTRWLDRIRAEVDATHADAAERIPMFFEVVADWLETESYRGSPYLNTLVEIRDPMHPARRVIREYFQEVEDYLDRLISAAGYRHSRVLAAEIETLISGAIALAVVHASRAPVLAARDAAVRLLAGAARG